MLAEVHGRIAGICLYFPMYSSWLGESGLYIQDLFVHEEFRSARIGEKLFRQF
ncbi:GNAT family N-acetyltransferase [Sinorhizobium meliloti]|uniref:GNAT family N-acetyltransferase n=1 Tax=Rhizobium meliloti TaxID=382 RepID=UPI003B51DC51